MLSNFPRLIAKHPKMLQSFTYSFSQILSSNLNSEFFKAVKFIFNPQSHIWVPSLISSVHSSAYGQKLRILTQHSRPYLSSAYGQKLLYISPRAFRPLATTWVSSDSYSLFSCWQILLNPLINSSNRVSVILCSTRFRLELQFTHLDIDALSNAIAHVKLQYHAIQCNKPTGIIYLESEFSSYSLI